MSKQPSIMCNLLKEIISFCRITVDEGDDQMEQELKLALGKILGEVYRIQKYQGITDASDGKIFGLLNGFEEAIESELGSLSFISEEKISIVSDVLTPFWTEQKEISELPSFTDLRLELERKGISHGQLITILKYLRATNRFDKEIDKLGSFKLSKDEI